jgi:DNA-binding NtrC family response regulator
MTGSFKEGMAAIRDAFERAFIASALTRHDGNVTRAAKRLGWRRPYLSRRLHALGIRRGTSTAPPSPPDPS